MAKKRKSKKAPEAEEQAPEAEEQAPEAEEQAPEPADPGPDAADESNYEPASYVIAKGRSICCGGRILTAGMSVSPGDIHHDPAVGEKHFNEHHAMGTIVEK
jgi:hypothetical protein